MEPDSSSTLASYDPILLNRLRCRASNAQMYSRLRELSMANRLVR